MDVRYTALSPRAIARHLDPRLVRQETGLSSRKDTQDSKIRDPIVAAFVTCAACKYAMKSAWFLIIFDTINSSMVSRSTINR